MKTLLKNALIYGGTGEKPYKSDVLISGELITEVGNELKCTDAQVVDLNKLSLSSGFFDSHSHNDWFAIKKNPYKYFEPFVKQGITSFITGNCGLSAVGFEPDSPYNDIIGGGLFKFDNDTGRYATVSEYLNKIHKNTPMNIAVLLGHGTARTCISGYEDRPLCEEELERMLFILETGLKEGACGLSLGLMYKPGIFAPFGELKAVSRLCEKYNLPLTVHPRACSAVSMAYPNLLGRPHLLRALDELEELSKGTNLKLQYSHAIFVGKSSLKYKNDVVDILDRMRKNGVDAMFDIYANDNGVSVITVVLPAWYQALNINDKKKLFNKLKLSVMIKASKKLLGFGFDNIKIAYLGEGYEHFEGKTVHDIAVELGMSDINAYLHLCDVSGYSGRVIMSPYNTLDITNDLSKHDNVLFMTDAWVEEKGIQNQAIYDCFPKFLHFSLNGKGDCAERTVRKMTGAVADRFSIKKRGYIKPGYFADITIFDENKLKKGKPDTGTPFGIEKVYINGNLVLENNNINTDLFLKSGHGLKAT